MNNNSDFVDLSILIVGFDGYKDVWDNFIFLLNKNWPNRPITYLATSELTPKYENVIVVPAGKESEWSKRAQTALQKIDTKYTLLLLEDFFVAKRVDNHKIKDIMSLIRQNDIKFYQILVQLFRQRWAKGKHFNGNKNLHIIPQGKKYPINLQAAIWETDYLRKCIGAGNYNAWKFEIDHINDSDYNEDKIDAIIDASNPLNIIHGIVQSKYLRGAVRKLKRAGIEEKDLFSNRSQLDFINNLRYQTKLIAYSLIPKRYEQVFKRIGKLLGVDFVTDRVIQNNRKNL